LLAPDYNGIDLASRRGWAAAMQMLHTVARPADPATAPAARPPGKARPSRTAPRAKAAPTLRKRSGRRQPAR
jgi:hypothetical protein